MQNRLMFLIFALIILYLLLTEKGKQIVSNVSTIIRQGNNENG
jgi:hypothetical protein